MPSPLDEADVSSPSPFAYNVPSPEPQPPPPAKSTPTLTHSTPCRICTLLSQQMSKDFDPLDSLTEEEDEDDDSMKYRVMPDLAKGRATSSYSQPPATLIDEGKTKPKLRRKFEDTNPPTPSKKIKGRQPASAADFGDEQWRDLHAAVQQIALENMARLYELAPSLDPWRPKGRLNEKVRQFFRHARGASPGSMGLSAVELSLSPTSSQTTSQGSGPASSQDSTITTTTMASTSSASTSSTGTRGRARDREMTVDTDADTPTSSPKTPTSAASSQTYHWPVKQQQYPHHQPHSHQHQHPRHPLGGHNPYRFSFEPPAHFAPTSVSTNTSTSTASIFTAMRPCTEPGARKRRLSELPAVTTRSVLGSGPASAPGHTLGLGLGSGLGLYTNAHSSGGGGGGGRMYDAGSGGWRHVGLGSGGARASVAAGVSGRASAAGAAGAAGIAAAAANGVKELKGERTKAHGLGRGY